MRKMMKKICFVLMIGVLVTGCTIVRDDSLGFSVRMTAEQISQGSFTGGRLIYSATDLNQLTEGVLIPVLDQLQGFVPVDGGEYEFKTIEERYGYYYVVEATPDKLILDYLLYNENGQIITHEEGIEVFEDEIHNRQGHLLNVEAIHENHYGLAFIKYDNMSENVPRSLQNVSLLSFPMEIPSENEQMTIDIDKRYRTVLFRLQKSGTQPYAYESGIISAHHSEPALVIDSVYYDQTDSDRELISINDPDLPEIEVGDYILDSSTSTARKVTGISAVNGSSESKTYETDIIHLQEAVGALRIQLEGDLAEMIQRYGTKAAKEKLNAFVSRGNYNIFDSQATASLWKGEDTVQLEIGYDIHLGVNVNLKANVSWHEVSGKGGFAVESKNGFNFFFDLQGHASDTEKKGTFFTIPIDIDIEKFKLGVELNIIADYESEESTPASLDYIMSLNTGQCDFGVDFDIGAKLAFKLGFIPYAKTWHHCNATKKGFNKGSAFLDEPHLKQLQDNSVNIGINAVFDFDIFKALIFGLDANTGFNIKINKKDLQDYDWWADIGVYGSLEHLKFGIGIPFSNIGHTWDFGTIWTLDPESEEGHITSIPLDDIMDP